MKHWVRVAIPFAILLVLMAWRFQEKNAEYRAQAKERLARISGAPSVSVAPVQVRDIVHTFNATGTTEAPLKVSIAPKVTGRIQYLQLHEGDPVKKGEVLVKIDPRDVEAEVDSAKAALAEAQYHLAQAQLTQNPTNVGVNTQIRQQKAAVSSAEANYNQTYQNFNKQVQAAEAAVTDANNRVKSADAAITQAKAQIDSAKANLEDAQVKYDRTYSLYKQGFTAAQDVDDAKAAVAVQAAAVEVAQGQLGVAIAGQASEVAQQQSAEQQASIVKTAGEANIEAARAAKVQAEASAEYAIANIAQKPAYEASIRALQASVDAAKGSLAYAVSELTDTTLVSPLDGFVTGRFADPGAVATSGMPVMEVQFMRSIWVAVEVPEEVSRWMNIGKAATITFDALPGRTFTGNIIQFNPSADPMSRQFVVKVIVDNSKNLIKTGMFSRISIETSRAPNAVVVPREAVRTNESGSIVYTVDAESKAHIRPVTVGDSDPTYIQIVDGLAPGEHVITMVANALKEGQKVRVATGSSSKSGGAQGRYGR